MDKSTCRALSKAITEALAGVESEFGVKITAGRGTYDARGANLKLKVAQIDEDGIVQTEEHADFLTYSNRHGIPTDRIGTTYGTTQRGKPVTYKILGFRVRALKNDILVLQVGGKNGGKKYVVPHHSVLLAIGLNPTEAKHAAVIESLNNLS